MSVKGKMSRSSLGQVMPVHADPLGFKNASFRAVNQVTFSATSSHRNLSV